MEESPAKVRKPRVPKVPKAPRKPRQSAAKLGVKQTSRITTKRLIKSTVQNNTTNPLIATVLIAGLGALASYFINKQ